MPLETGSRLGPYEIIDAIGAGGMGEVYRARDTRLGREVAIKVLPRELTRDPERLARFAREARSASALNHRNIVTIHDFSSQDGETCLVMELIRGKSLRDVLSRGALPVRQLIDIGVGITEGLAAAHAAGIVHRDLKPENVMVTADGTPKLVDFGLVKSQPACGNDSPTEVQLSRAGTMLGTMAYMSPEQARAEDVDFHTDQFSLGVILHEMATGKHPLRRSTPAETLGAILRDDPPPLGNEFPVPLLWIVERCLAKNPADRYGSTADLAHDLRRLQKNDVPLPSRVQKAAISRGSVGAIIAAGLMVGAAIFLRRPNANMTGPMEVALSLPNIERVAFGWISQPVAISPDGRFVALLAAANDGIDKLWIHDLQSGATRAIAGSDHPFGVSFSPDSRSVAYCAESKLKSASVEGGPPRIICDASPPGMPAWHGNTILFAQRNGIFQVNAQGGTPRLVVRVDPSRPLDIPLWPQFLPGEDRFLYVVTIRRNEEMDHELWVGSLSGEPSRRITAMDSHAVFSNGNLLFVRDGALLAQPFDTDHLRFTGEARPLLDDVYYFRSTGLAAFSVSDTGLLVWRSRPRPTREVWFDRGGVNAGVLATGGFLSGRLSPDDTRYAATLVDPRQGTSDVWIFELSRHNSERLTFHLTEEANPVWSPDGRTIYYRSDVLGPPDIFRRNLDEDHGNLLYAGPAVEQPEDVSLDGKWLLFVTINQVVASRISSVPVGSASKPRPFASTPFTELSPRFSPDGRWVAYQSDASGRPEVYVRAFQTSALATRISTDGGTKPRWRRDGSELFFLGPDGGLMTVPMSGGASTAPPRMLFRVGEAVDFEPVADGSRFLMQLEERVPEPAVHLMINWPARLKAKD